jgi:tRNA (cmo5U34)-methyltransferase
MSDSRDHQVDGRWEFDEKVGIVFDDMVQRSVPLYDQTLDLLGRIAMRHCPAGCQSTILDLGCSNGQALHRIMSVAANEGAAKTRTLRFIGVDSQEHMLTRLSGKFGSAIETHMHDLRYPLPYRIASCSPRVVLLLWTAQFIPLEHRARLFAEIRKTIAPDGCLLVAEKLRGQTAAFQTMMSHEYAMWKQRVGGYSAESVEAKARSLEGVLVSLTAPEMKQSLQAEGFAVEEVTRYLGFAAYYALPK